MPMLEGVATAEPGPSLKAQIQRDARLCLSKTWDSDTALRPGLAAAFACGWRGGLGEGLSYSDAEYVSTTIASRTAIPRVLAEAMITQLEHLGLRLYRDHPTDGHIPKGMFHVTQARESIDRDPVSGFCITMAGDTFRDRLAPMLEQWRAQAHGARVV